MHNTHNVCSVAQVTFECRAKRTYQCVRNANRNKYLMIIIAQYSLSKPQHNVYVCNVPFRIFAKNSERSLIQLLAVSEKAKVANHHRRKYI